MNLAVTLKGWKNVRNLNGILMAAVVVLGVIYAYNAFIAKPGKTIADLGKRDPAKSE